MMKLLKSPIFWRFLLWSLLLSLVPLGIVMIFMQRQVVDAMNAQRSQEAKNYAGVIVSEVMDEPQRLQEIVNQYGKEGLSVFAVDENGIYLAHTDEAKVGQPAEEDLGAPILQEILAGGSGSVQEGSQQASNESPVIGYSSIDSPDKLSIAVSIESVATTTFFRKLTSSISWQLIVSLVITSIIGIVGVLTVLNPLLKLSGFADRLGQGRLEERIGTEEMEGELKVLANSLNTMAERVLQSIQTLEQRVAERTHDLEVRSNQLRATAETTQTASTILDPDELLQTAVGLIQEKFNLYYVGLFELEGQWANLRAGSGEAGRKMQARGHKIQLGNGMIGWSIINNLPRIAQKAELDEVRLLSPELPDTRSEAAVPLRARGQVVGALSIQGSQVDLFNQDNLAIFQILADQIAIAIDNARLFKEQIKTTEQLRTLDKMKDQFMASMSHELRTPLNAIINFVEMVAMGMVGEISTEQKDLLDQSLKSSNHLLHLINDVLDINKIQAGKLTLFLEQDVNLYAELDAALNMVTPMVMEKSQVKPLQLIQDIDSDLPMITGDKRRIRQVLLNLLTNAIKFTEEGTITLSAKNQGDRVVLAVIDTGPGIPGEDQVTIFEPFVQAMAGRKKVEGTGLGLPIARSLVEAHGGKLWFESQPGEGAAFYFSLPVVRDQDAIKTKE